MKTLDGKVALVTGATRGIGKGIVIALAKAATDMRSCTISDEIWIYRYRWETTFAINRRN